jgi:hypothetical protein
LSYSDVYEDLSSSSLLWIITEARSYEH